MYQIVATWPKLPFAPANKKLIFDPVFAIDISKTKDFRTPYAKQMPASTFRRALPLILLVLIAGSVNAQTPTKTKKRPNIPGSFIVDFGLNGTQGSPDLWKTGLLGSRTVNLYYQYPLRFGRSKFSFNPGIGFSFERFKWKNNTPVILHNPVESNPDEQIEKYEFTLASSRFGPNNGKKITLNNSYLEVPIELRFDTKPEDISRSFNFAFGARGGWMFDSFMKVKYKDEGQKKKLKDHQEWGFTQLRYGVYTRIGIGGFNFFVFYNLTPLFQKGKGPTNDDFNEVTNQLITGPTGTTMTTFTAGLSLNGF